MDNETSANSYDAVIADLESKVASMLATIANLKSLRDGSVPIRSDDMSVKIAPQRSGVPVSFRHDAFFGMTATEAAKKYLSAIKKTASVTVLAEALQAGGWKTASKNVTETLRVTLGRHPDFVKINAEFGLAEWYPGRRTSQRRAGSGALSESSSEESSD
jgi:hypothetical protein